jgi:hypothetical protein
VVGEARAMKEEASRRKWRAQVAYNTVKNEEGEDAETKSMFKKYKSYSRNIALVAEDLRTQLKSNKEYP